MLGGCLYLVLVPTIVIFVLMMIGNINGHNIHPVTQILGMSICVAAELYTGKNLTITCFNTATFVKYIISSFYHYYDSLVLGNCTVVSGNCTTG